jgi:hypothetical protein
MPLTDLSYSYRACVIIINQANALFIDFNSSCPFTEENKEFTFINLYAGAALARELRLLASISLQTA